MRVENIFDIGQIVYLVTDPEQNKRIVTGLLIKPNSILYELSCGSNCSNHYAMEISADVDILTQIER